MNQNNFVELIAKWVEWVCETKDKASPEAIAALPAMAGLIIGFLPRTKS